MSEVLLHPEAPWMLAIPGAGNAEPGDYVMQSVGAGTYSKLAGDVFVGLYIPS
jgi:hypothetical protein